MKARGIFAIVAAFVASFKGVLRTHASPNTQGRVSNGRQAFYSVSGPRRASQSKNYAKGWA
jgi:hypothetical protein